MNGALAWLAGFDARTLLVGFAVLGMLLAVPLEVVALRRLFKLRLVPGTIYFLLGAFLIALGVLAGVVAASLHGYNRLTHEQIASAFALLHHPDEPGQ